MSVTKRFHWASSKNTLLIYIIIIRRNTVVRSVVKDFLKNTKWNNTSRWSMKDTDSSAGTLSATRVIRNIETNQTEWHMRGRNMEQLTQSSWLQRELYLILHNWNLGCRNKWKIFLNKKIPSLFLIIKLRRISFILVLIGWCWCLMTCAS